MTRNADEGWLQEKAATGMYELHLRVRELPITHTKPYVAWRSMMEYILSMEGWPHEETTFLDVGCGVGLYAPLIDRCFPGVQYSGCDISPHMIDYAKREYGGDRFFVSNMVELKAGADIIFASSVVEPCPYWRFALRRLMSVDFEYLILHRVRMWNHSSRPNRERVYMTMYDIPTFEVVHNRPELWRLITAAGGKVVYVVEYQQQPDFGLYSILIKKNWSPRACREYWSNFVLPELEMRRYQAHELAAPEHQRPREQQSPMRLGRVALEKREAAIAARLGEGFAAVKQLHLYEEILEYLCILMGNPEIVVISVLDWWFKPVMDAVYEALIQFSEWEIGLRVNEFAEMYLQRTSAVPKETSAGDDDSV